MLGGGGAFTLHSECVQGFKGVRFYLFVQDWPNLRFLVSNKNMGLCLYIDRIQLKWGIIKSRLNGNGTRTVYIFQTYEEKGATLIG